MFSTGDSSFSTFVLVDSAPFVSNGTYSPTSNGNPTIIKILIGGFSMIQIDTTTGNLTKHLPLVNCIAQGRKI